MSLWHRTGLLWLISASNDKALSFIDHHLKCGNGIIGTTIKKYQEIKEIGSDTKEDVEQQRKVYDEIQEDLAVTKRSMQEEFRMKWRELQQLMHTKCQKAGILVPV